MIIKQDFNYSLKNENRRLHIYLPDDYYSSNENYPVMYFFDGQNMFEDSEATFGRSWRFKDFLDNYDKKFVIVSFECSHTGNDRLAEYNPFKCFSGFLAGLPAQGEETMKWIINEVKPYVDNNFRVYRHREATGIGGSSMGGLMAVYATSHYNHIFSKGACISSAIGFVFAPLMKDMNNCYINPDTRMFLSWGTKETRGIRNHHTIDNYTYSYRRNKAVANKIEYSGARVQLYSQLGGAHNEESWEKLIPIFMDFLWKWQYERFR